MEESETTDSESYYAILNVPKDASEEVIRKSYRQLAQIFHPDKASEQANGDSATQFMLIQEAYEVLPTITFGRDYSHVNVKRAHRSEVPDAEA